MNIQWYPGHMTKTRRQIEADLKHVDIVAEIIDARIPISSRNPDIDAICADKPRLIVLNRADQADPAQNRAWGEYFRKKGYAVLETDAKTGRGVNQFSSVTQEVLKEQISKWREKGQVGRPVRAMVVGVPNVGKSTFINKVARKKSAKAGDRPGVTRGKQWVNGGPVPWICWTRRGSCGPSLRTWRPGCALAFTGAVKDDIMDVETLGCHLMAYFGDAVSSMCWRRATRLKEVLAREAEENEVAYGYRLLEACAAEAGDADLRRRVGH